MVKINEVETFKPTGITALKFELLVYHFDQKEMLRLNKSATIKKVIDLVFKNEFGDMDVREIESKIKEHKTK